MEARFLTWYASRHAFLLHYFYLLFTPLNTKFTYALIASKIIWFLLIVVSLCLPLFWLITLQTFSTHTYKWHGNSSPRNLIRYEFFFSKNQNLSKLVINSTKFRFEFLEVISAAFSQFIFHKKGFKNITKKTPVSSLHVPLKNVYFFFFLVNQWFARVRLQALPIYFGIVCMLKKPFFPCFTIPKYFPFFF